MGSRLGVLKIAAKRLNVSFEEYLKHIRDGEKHCGKCRRWKQLDQFHIDNSRGDGKASICVQCRATKNPRHWLRGKSMPEDVKKKISRTLKKRYEKQSHHRKGQPNGRKGKRHSVTTREKISRIARQNALRGKDAPGYIDGKGVERRGIRHSAEYKRWRYDVYLRDGFACRHCGDSVGGNLVAHHIKPFADFPEERFNIHNGFTLCETCHHQVHYG